MKAANFNPTKIKHCGLFYVEKIKKGEPNYDSGRRRYRCRVCGNVVKDFPHHTRTVKLT